MGRNCELGSFLMLWPDIIHFGRITSDVITGMSVTQSNRNVLRRWVQILGGWVFAVDVTRGEGGR